MRYFCHICGKSVSSELPDNSVIRAVLICPECISTEGVLIVSNEKVLGEEKKDGSSISNSHS